MKVTKKQIAELYIPAAEEAINKSIKGKWNNQRFKDYLITHNLQYGVCFFIKEKGYRISDKHPSIKRFQKRTPYGEVIDSFWYKRPLYTISPKEKRECLQYRINILKNW